MDSFSRRLAPCETFVNGAVALIAGRGTLRLRAPGSTNDGTVRLTVNLGSSNSGTTCTALGGETDTVDATGAGWTYLQGNWTGSNYDQNPKARAAFGVFKGAEEVIDMRENF
jgi:MSHA biogenesis protein MshQ